MSCDACTSLLCKNTFWPLEILSSTPTFPIWSSRHFCTTTHLNISSKILPSVWRCQWIHTIHLHAKKPVMFFEKFEWITLFCILVQFGDLYCNLILFCSSNLELVALPSKPLSPGEWTHWRFLSACNKPFFFLSKTGVLQILH